MIALTRFAGRIPGGVHILMGEDFQMTLSRRLARPEAQPQTRNERPAAHQPPLRLCHTKDTNDHNQRNGPGDPRGTPEPTTVSYTPEERNLIRKGLRIWARVAVRSYMKRHGLAPEEAPLPPINGERESGPDGQRDEAGEDPEGRHAV